MRQKSKQEKYLTAVWIFAVLSTIGFIFGNSLMVASVSDAQSGGFFVFFTEKLGLTFLTHHFVRKAAHFSEYALLGMEMCFGVRFRRFFLFEKSLGVVLAVGSGFLVALADEFIQRFVPERGPSFADSLLDYAGFLTGALVLLGFFALLTYIKNKKQHKL
ncbi:MAG: VanZ family protein [Clostridia bacterium]|nr:VanZ family protein [Clostridia bacterium]